jgi:hypothetical protein
MMRTLHSRWLWAASLLVLLCSTLSLGAQGAKAFDTPQQAADALIDAASKFDISALQQIFGMGEDGVFLSSERPLDRQRASEFVARAREKQGIEADPKDAQRMLLVVGAESWPFPVPIVKRAGKWSYDAEAGKQELLFRRIGANELDAISICHGYVDAQYEYAMQTRKLYDTNQYAQRIVSSPGQKDGLAWQREDGTWAGPVGEKIARAIEQGYTRGAQPYHGYFFKILKGQGPAARLGELDFVVKGRMIGGFALVAAPAEYGVTGVKTFIVSHEGVVYERDFGTETLAEFRKMERYDPNAQWKPVSETAAD